VARAPARRRTAWIPGPAMAITAVSASSVTIGGTTIIPADATTIVRIRGEFLAFLTAAAAAGDGFRIGVGIGVASAAAVAAGSGSVPMPLDEDATENWLWHKYLHLHSSSILAAAASTDTDIANAVSAVARVEIDSKAMRRSEGRSFYLAVQTALTGTATVEFVGRTRVLSMSP